MHKFRLLLFIFFLGVSTNSCNKKKNWKVPADEATVEQRKKIDFYLEDIRLKFESLGLSIDVYALPTVVTEDLNQDAAGECFGNSHIRLRKKYIESIFGGHGDDSQLWLVLAHEIGHCYFDLGHYEKRLQAPSGFELQTVEQSIVDGTVYSYKTTTDWFAGTVMSTELVSYSNSESVRLFYLKELAGMVSGTKVEEFIAEEGIDLVESTE